MVTIKDVAKLAKVSVATVSRTTGNYGYVAEETRKKITNACEALHYKPNAIARSMIKKKTNTLGLVIADIHDPFYINIIDVVEEIANQHGYSILFCNSNEDIEKENASVRVLIERQVGGIILVPVMEHYEVNRTQMGKAGIKVKKTSSQIDDLIRNEIPFIFLDRYIKDVDADAVILNNEKIAYEATMKLVGMGYQDIVVVANSTVDERLSGVRKAFADLGKAFPQDRVLVCDNTARDACVQVLDFLNRETKPAALLALDNLMTLGAIKAIVEKKYAIMEDIYVMGFDDIDLYEGLTPRSISTITQPIATMGQLATEMLIAKIEGRSKGQTHKIIRLEATIKQYERSSF
jgi:LacI family transcriptional regulator